MTRYRLPAFALMVAALVAVVAVVAHGRPLAASSGRGGLPGSFWDYLLTSAVIFIVLMWLVVIVAVVTLRPDHEFAMRLPSARSRLLRSLLALLVPSLIVAGWFLFHHPQAASRVRVPGGLPNGGKPPAATSGGPHFLWVEVAIVFGLLAVAGAIVVATSRRRAARRQSGLPTAPEAVAAALDVSLDDLRTDPDLRRAIVAAYARMEKALGVTGLPRRPSEAPLEYLERALLALDTSGPSVRRLTDLFEWAKFSQHEPEPSMRDEAVDALEAVRDELRAPVEVAA